MEERAGHKAHLVWVGEEPIVGMGEGDIRQDEEAAKQRQTKDHGQRTTLRATDGVRARLLWTAQEWGCSHRIEGTI
jgi:hypothetical protein